MKRIALIGLTILMLGGCEEKKAPGSDLPDVSMVHRKQESDTKRMEKTLVAAKEEVQMLREENRRLEIEVARLNAEIDLSESRIENARKLGNAEATLENLTNRRTHHASTTRQQYNSPVAAPVIPSWYPPAPSVVTKTIRDNAAAEHNDNFVSMNYEIERQTEAYAKILRYYKTADPGIRALINKAALEYGSNYTSFAYEIERQIEASQKLNGR